MFATLNQQIDTRLLLEKDLASSLAVNSRDLDTVEEVERAGTTAIEVYDMIGIDYSNLERIRKFIIGDSAFETLRRNTPQFAKKEQLHPENLNEKFEKSFLSLIKANQIGSCCQKFQSGLTKQARIVLIIQKFIKSMRTHLVVHIDSVTDQIVDETPGLLSKSFDSKVLVQASDVSVDTDMTSKTDMEPGTDDTHYDSSDLPDNPELSLSSEERIVNPKACFEKLQSLEQQIYDDSGVFIHKTAISTGQTQDEALLCLPGSKYSR
ncbi:hypothetical protein DID88_004569 [Monilinia fructigena]|uniref:Uncharacterized protein n=1 Tax=Monilinia fructigena TaxID=38457 RepID=A0A395IRM9_9HELO|nr:hypothetical protein DID88_004569 [Monilinia fructigena]